MRIFLLLFLLVPYMLQAQDTASIPQVTTQQVQPEPVLTQTEMEELLRTAPIVKWKWLGTGVTNPRKLTLNNGKIEFHAIFKTVDDRRPGMTTMTDGREIDFKDSWKYDVAAYEIDKILGLNMIPVTVERTYKGEKGAIQWWVENAFTERDRIDKDLKPSDLESHNQAIFKVRLFDNLLFNIDRNLGNLIYDPAWKVWMIDHTRCFKNMGHLKSPGDLKKFSTSMVASLRKLDEKQLKQICGKYLTGYEISSMIKRRDAILQLYEKMYAEKGDSILFP